MVEDKLILSVIIPVHGRNDLLNREVDSVINSKGSQNVEIIVVDDCSPEPIVCDKLRSFDTLIRLEVNKGAAVCRNIGIENSKADIISLLDSDDYYINRNFYSDLEIIKNNKNALYYCSIESQLFSSRYPDNILFKDFFDNIFCQNPHVLQTSSLFFDKNLGLRFDEKLPKHQDWDFAYQACKSGIELKKVSSQVFFDREDQKSLSRKFSPDKSEPWYEKICEDFLDNKERDYVYFNLFCLSREKYTWVEFFKVGCGYVSKNKLRLSKLVKFTIRRAVQ